MKAAGIPLATPRLVLPRSHQDAGGRAHDRHEAQGLGRDERDLQRRSDHAHLLHQGGDEAELPPRVDHLGNRLRRHQRVRPRLRPEPVGARLRHRHRRRAVTREGARRLQAARVVVRHAAARHQHERHRRRRRQPALHRPPARGARPHGRQLHRRHPGATGAPGVTQRFEGDPLLRQARPLARCRLRRPRQPEPHLVGPERDQGEDETGTVGTGSYRFVDNARRFLPGHYPTEPIKFFDPANTITRFDTTPPELQAKVYPKPHTDRSSLLGGTVRRPS